MNETADRQWTKMWVDEGGMCHLVQAIRANKEDYDQTANTARSLWSVPNPPSKLMMDMRGVELSTLLPLRKEYIELNALASTTLKQIALVSDSGLLKVFLSFNFNAGHLKDAAQNVKLFTNEEEAMKWLRAS